MTLINFNNQFQYARSKWNGQSFALVAGEGHCGNDHRVPYLVSSVQYDGKSKTAALLATEKAFDQIFHSYDFHMGKLPQDSNIRFVRRGIDDADDEDEEEEEEDFGHLFDLTHSSEGRAGFTLPPYSVDFICQPCNSSGGMNFGVDIKSSWGDLKLAKLRIEPRALSFYTNFKTIMTTDGGFTQSGTIGVSIF